MRYAKYIAPVALLGLFMLFSGTAAHAQVRFGVGVGVGPAYGGVAVGPAPSCAYGYYGYAPYACAPYGYYGSDYFVNGAFIGAGTPGSTVGADRVLSDAPASMDAASSRVRFTAVVQRFVAARHFAGTPDSAAARHLDSMARRRSMGAVISTGAAGSMAVLAVTAAVGK